MRLFIADLITKRPVRTRRRYASLDNAIRGSSLWAAKELHAGEKIVVFHDRTGMELGYHRCTAKGIVLSRFHFER